MARPSNMDDVVGQRIPDGETEARDVTAFERIVQSLRSGNYFEQAAAQAGVGRETAYGWLRTGARSHARLHRGLTTDTDLTDHERRCIAFSDAVAQAESEWEVNANNVLENLGRGGIVSTTVTEKTDAAGNVLERTTKKETLAPNPQVIEWRLSRRFPERYMQRVEIDDRRSPGALTVEDRARILADEIREHQAAAAMGAEAALAVRALPVGACGAHPRSGPQDASCIREPGHPGRHRYDVSAGSVDA